MKKYKVGYTQGVFDMFHVGHLNLLNKAKKYCDKLIVGVNSDSLVKQYKNKKTVINENDRKRIVENIKAVDSAIIVSTLDKIEIFKTIKFDVVFIGDDWRGNSRWVETEKKLKEINVDLVFIPYTKGISSTILRDEKVNRINDFNNNDENKD